MAASMDRKTESHTEPLPLPFHTYRHPPTLPASLPPCPPAVLVALKFTSSVHYFEQHLFFVASAFSGLARWLSKAKGAYCGNLQIRQKPLPPCLSSLVFRDRPDAPVRLGILPRQAGARQTLRRRAKTRDARRRGRQSLENTTPATFRYGFLGGKKPET